eukprot:UC4_evm1s637
MGRVRGVDPMSLIYDDLVAEKVLWAPLGSSVDLTKQMELLRHPHVKIGLGDGGAHLGIFQEASCPTFMLSHYVRDRNGDKFTIEEESDM